MVKSPAPNCMNFDPDSSVGKESTCNAGDPSLIPGLGRSPGERIGWLPTPVFFGFPCGSNLQGGRSGFNPWVGKIPQRRAWQPTAGFLPGESQGRGSLVGFRLWGRTESDTTEAT